MARFIEAGLFSLGAMALAAAKFGVPSTVTKPFVEDEPKTLMSSSNPWSKHYVAPATVAAVYYRNCDAARSAGAAPMRRGQPGYRSQLDADGDGIACEPYRGR